MKECVVSTNVITNVVTANVVTTNVPLRTVGLDFVSYLRTRRFLSFILHLKMTPLKGKNPCPN